MVRLTKEMLDEAIERLKKKKPKDKYLLKLQLKNLNGLKEIVTKRDKLEFKNNQRRSYDYSVKKEKRKKAGFFKNLFKTKT